MSITVTAHTGTDLYPLPVAADHLSVGDAAEKAFGRRVLRESGQELSDVDEVHLQEHFLVEPQNPKPRAEQELLPVSAEHVPHPTRHIQGQGLSVEGEDPVNTDLGIKKTVHV